MDLSQVKCDLPYPEVNVTKDLSEARLILPNYAGRDSETTAILTYAYQSYMTADLKKILEEIAIVEMTHHEMLGEAIVKLGGYPIIGSGCFWNGSFINYTSNPKVYLKNNCLLLLNIFCTNSKVALSTIAGTAFSHTIQLSSLV